MMGLPEEVRKGLSRIIPFSVIFDERKYSFVDEAAGFSYRISVRPYPFPKTQFLIHVTRDDRHNLTHSFYGINKCSFAGMTLEKYSFADERVVPPKFKKGNVILWRKSNQEDYTELLDYWTFKIPNWKLDRFHYRDALSHGFAELCEFVMKLPERLEQERGL